MNYMPNPNLDSSLTFISQLSETLKLVALLLFVHIKGDNKVHRRISASQIS